MKITGVVLEGIGKFGARTEIAGFDAGVNVLAAGNEAGKSTLFRAIRACLFERHNTRNELVRGLATDGLSLPATVTLQFEHDGQAYTIRKSFVKGAAASLARDGIEIARGREADEKVWELLGVQQGSRSVDDAAFGILWVGQGQSVQAPRLTDAGTTALNSAIQAEVGTLVGGERARAVLAALKEALAPLVTEATGRPKSGGPLAEATARLDTLHNDLADAERSLALLDSQFVDLAARQAERAGLADPAERARMAADLAAARLALKAGEESAALLAQFQAAELHSRTVLDRAQQRLDGLQERAARIDQDRRREAEQAAALAPLDAQADAARAARRLVEADMAALAESGVAGEQEEHVLRRLAAAAERAATRADHVRRLADLEALGARLVAVSAGLSGNLATAEVAAAVDTAERELSLLVARLEAAAPYIAVELGAAAAAGQVTLADRPLRSSVTHAVVDPVTIRIGDIATITVSPADKASAADRERRARLQAQLAILLRDAGAGTAAALRAARAQRTMLETQALALRAELRALGVHDPSPASAIEQAKTEVARIDAMVAAALSQAAREALPTADEIAARQAVLQEGRETARRQRQVLDGRLAAQNDLLTDLAGRRGRLAGDLAAIQARLAADTAMLPDGDRARLIDEATAALAAARDAHGVKAAALEEQRRRAPPADELERRRLRVGRLEAATEGQRSRLDMLDRDIARLEGQIESAGGDGLGEKAAALRAEAELVHREVDSHRARVAVLQLLRQTIEACYREQRDRLHAPLRRHLQPYMSDVFPAAEIELGDGFAIAGIRRNGPTPETFERLSVGTQEQIAVLVRLAMGALICERGQEVPIILDDALVFSDDARIERMFDALNRAGRKQQVIVLTCRTRVFASLGGRHLSIRTDA